MKSQTGSYIFLKRLFGITNSDVFFYLLLSALFAAFIFCLLLACFKSGYTVKRRCWFIAIVIFACGTAKARTELLYEEDISAFIFAIGAILFLPLALIRVKAADLTASREFIRLLDDGMNKKTGDTAGDEREPLTPDKERNFIIDDINGADGRDALKPLKKEYDNYRANAEAENERKDTQNKTTLDLDFSHVKTVIKRLGDYQLSSEDKRKIRELEFYLSQAENGVVYGDIRAKINESLGNLLKIMARRGG